MSNPDNAATQKKADPAPASFAEKVSTIVKEMVQDNKGTWVLPEGDHSEEVKFAAMAEKRRRDTQSSLGKARQEVAAVSHERDAFKTQLSKQVTISLTDNQEQELKELKFTDPDAWRTKMNEYESEASTKMTESFTEVSTTAKANSESERRKAVLGTFIEDNPGFSLIDDDVPPRISKKLESGDSSFEEFLVEVKEYQGKNHVLASDKPDTKQAGLNNLAGGSTPSDQAMEGDIALNYEKHDTF